MYSAIVTMGDPTGVGLEVFFKAFRVCSDIFTPILVADRSSVEVAKKLVGDVVDRFRFVSTFCEICGGFESPLIYQIDSLDRDITYGKPTYEDVKVAQASIDKAVELISRGIGDVLITLPVSKYYFTKFLGIEFVGHTHYLASKFGLEEYGSEYLMLFVTPDFKVAFLSDHLPLAQAISLVKKRRIIEVVQLLLEYRLDIEPIAVCGLNPHAGEGGLLGREEIEEIIPAVEELRARGVNIDGPFSPDCAIDLALEGKFETVLSLYHDQVLVPIKLIYKRKNVNVTVGLPYIRLSPDHGTAYEIAGLGVADCSSMVEVVKVGSILLKNRGRM